MKLIKWVVRGIGLLMLLMLIGGVLPFFYQPGSLPATSSANWAIQTYSTDGLHIPSRIYYAEKVEFRDGVPVISGYWTFDGEKYHKQRGEKALPVEECGIIDIIRRR